MNEVTRQEVVEKAADRWTVRVERQRDRVLGLLEVLRLELEPLSEIERLDPDVTGLLEVIERFREVFTDVWERDLESATSTAHELYTKEKGQ